MWHKMTFIGKVLLFLVGFGFGTAFGLYIAPDGDAETNTGNKTEINIGDIKEKGEGDIIIDLKSEQKQDQKEEKKESSKEDKKRWWQVWK